MEERENTITSVEELICLVMSLPENVMLTVTFGEEWEHGEKKHV